MDLGFDFCVSPLDYHPPLPEGVFWVKNAPFTVNRAFFTIFRQAEGGRAEGGFYPGPFNNGGADSL